MKEPAHGSILIVEDEMIVANGISKSLASLGYDITGNVPDADSALDCAGREKPDLAIIDIRLRGDCDGIIAASELKQRHNIPCIYLTSFSDSNTISRAKRTEPLGFIIKPFQKQELSTCVEIALYRIRMAKERDPCSPDHPAIRSLDRGAGRFVMDLAQASSREVVQFTSMCLHRYFNESTVAQMQICVGEMIQNALEHGSLEIGFETKTRALESGYFADLLESRKNNPLYKNRHIIFKYSINADRALFRIEDEGPGFDHENFHRREHELLSSDRRMHGRGIAISRQLFDTIEYDRGGRRVTMIMKTGPSNRAV